MPIEKHPGDYVGVRLTVEHRGWAASPWWGFFLIYGGVVQAALGGGGLHNISEHANWTPVSYTFSWQLPIDIPLHTYGCKAGLWPSKPASTNDVVNADIISMATLNVFDVVSAVPVVAPVISSLSPSPCPIGYTELRVRGSNFAPLPSDNGVYFRKGALFVSRVPYSATTTELRVDLSKSSTLSDPGNAGVWEVWMERLTDGQSSNHVSLTLTAPAPGTAEYRSLEASSWAARVREFQRYMG